MSYLDDVRAGQAGIDDLDDYVEAWHNGAKPELSLHEFLGMDFATYATVIVSRRELERLVMRYQNSS